MEEITEKEIPKDSSGDKLVEEASLSENKPAALTLVIQSWATPIVGIIMLAIGLLAGYYGRPLISPIATPEATAQQNQSLESSDLQVTVPTPDADRAAQQKELMSALVERTRHYLGDQNAPVTIIEFSDFQ